MGILPQLLGIAIFVLNDWGLFFLFNFRLFSSLF